MSDPQRLMLQAQQKLQQQIIPMKQYPQQLNKVPVSQIPPQQIYPPKQSQLVNSPTVLLGGLNQAQQQQQQQQQKQQQTSLIFHRPQQQNQPQNMIILGSQSKQAVQSVVVVQNQTIISNQVKNIPIQQQNQAFSRSVVHHHTYNPIYSSAGQQQQQQQQQQQPLIQTITQAIPTGVTGASSTTVQIRRINSQHHHHHHHILKHSSTLPIIENGQSLLMGSQISIPSNPTSSRNIQQIVTSPRVLMTITPIQQQQQQQAQEQQQQNQFKQQQFQQCVQLAQNVKLSIPQYSREQEQQQQQQQQQQKLEQQQLQCQQYSSQISGMLDQQQQQQQLNSNSSQLEYEMIAISPMMAERIERNSSYKSKGIEEISIVDQSEQEQAGNQSSFQQQQEEEEEEGEEQEEEDGQDHRDNDSYARNNANEGNNTMMERLSEDNTNNNIQGDNSQRNHDQSIRRDSNQVINQGITGEGYQEEEAAAEGVEIHSQNTQQLEEKLSYSSNSNIKDSAFYQQPQLQQEEQEEQFNGEHNCQVTEILPPPISSPQSQEIDKAQTPAQESAETFPQQEYEPATQENQQAHNQMENNINEDELRQKSCSESAIHMMMSSSQPETNTNCNNKQEQTQENNQINTNISDKPLQDPSSCIEIDHHRHDERQHSEPPFRFSSQFIPPYVPHYKTQTRLSLDSVCISLADTCSSKAPEVLNEIKTQHQFNPEKIANTLQAARMIHSELRVVHGLTQQQQQQQLVGVEMEQQKGDTLTVKADQQWFQQQEQEGKDIIIKDDNGDSRSSGVNDSQYYQNNNTARGQYQTETNAARTTTDHDLWRTLKPSALVNDEDNVQDALGKAQEVKQVLEFNSLDNRDDAQKTAAAIIAGENTYLACCQEVKNTLEEQQSSVGIAAVVVEDAAESLAQQFVNSNVVAAAVEVIQHCDNMQQGNSAAVPEEVPAKAAATANGIIEKTVPLQLTSEIAGTVDEQMKPLLENQQEKDQGDLSVKEQHNSTEPKTDNFAVGLMVVVDSNNTQKQNLTDAVIDLNDNKNGNEVNKQDERCQEEIKAMDYQMKHRDIDQQQEENSKQVDDTLGEVEKGRKEQHDDCESETQNESMYAKQESKRGEEDQNIDLEKSAQKIEDQGQSDGKERAGCDEEKQEEPIKDRIGQHQQGEDVQSQFVSTIQYQHLKQQQPQPSSLLSHAAGGGPAHLEVIHEEDTTFLSDPSVILTAAHLLHSSNIQPGQAAAASSDRSELLLASDSLQFSPSKVIIVQSYTNEEFEVSQSSLVKQSKESTEQFAQQQEEQQCKEGEQETQVKQEGQGQEQNNEQQSQQQYTLFNLDGDGSSLITSMNVASADKVQGQLLQQLLQSDFSGNLLASPQQDLIESQEQTENITIQDGSNPAGAIGKDDQVVTTAEVKVNDAKSKNTNHRSCLLEQLRNLHAQTLMSEQEQEQEKGRDQKEEEGSTILRQAAQLLCIPNSNLIESSDVTPEEIRVLVDNPLHEDKEVEACAGRGNVENKNEQDEHLGEDTDRQSADINGEGSDLVKLQQLISAKTKEIRTQIENIQQQQTVTCSSSTGYAAGNHADMHSNQQPEEIRQKNASQLDQNEGANDIPAISFMQLESLIDHKMQALMAKLASHAGGAAGRDAGMQKQDDRVANCGQEIQEKEQDKKKNYQEAEQQLRDNVLKARQQQKQEVEEEEQQQQYNSKQEGDDSLKEQADEKREEENIEYNMTEGNREEDTKMRLQEKENYDGTDNDNKKEEEVEVEGQADVDDDDEDEEDPSHGLINVYSAHRLELEELILQQQQKQDQESDKIGEGRSIAVTEDSKKKNASNGISKSAFGHSRVRFSNSFPHKNQDNTSLNEEKEEQQESQGIAPGDDDDDDYDHTTDKPTSDQHPHHHHHHYKQTHKHPPSSLQDQPAQPHNSLEKKQFYSFKFGKQNTQPHISRFAQSANLSSSSKVAAGTSPRLVVSPTKETKQPMHYFTTLSRKIKHTQSESSSSSISHSKILNSTKQAASSIPFSAIALSRRNHNTNQNSSSSSASNVSAAQTIKNKLDHAGEISKNHSTNSKQFIQKSAAINLSRIAERSYMPTINSINNGQSSIRSHQGNVTTTAASQETKTIVLLQQNPTGNSSEKMKGKGMMIKEQPASSSNNSASRVKSSSSNHSAGDTSKKRLAQLQQQILEIENQIKDLNEEHSQEPPNNDDNLPAVEVVVDPVIEELNKIQTEESLYSQSSPIQTNLQIHQDDEGNKRIKNYDTHTNHSVHSQMSSSSKQLLSYSKQIPNSPPSSSSYKQTRVNRLYYIGMLQDQRKKEIRLRIQSEDKIREDRQCPFSPTLYTSKESRKSVPQNFQQRQQLWLQGKEQHQTKLRESQSAESFRECTFKPELFQRMDASKDSTFVEHFYLEISKLKQKKRLQGIHSQSPLSKSSGFQSSYSSKRFYHPPSTHQSASAYHFRAASSSNTNNNNTSKSQQHQQQSVFNSVRQRLSFNKEIQSESR